MVSKRHNVVSVYLSDEEFLTLKELAEADDRSRTQEARLLMLKGIDALRKESSDELAE